MNESTSNPPSKYRADLLFWSLAIWGLHWLCGAALDQVAGAVLNCKLSLEEMKVPKEKKRWWRGGDDAGDICLLFEPNPAHCGAAWQFWVTLSVATYHHPAPIRLVVAEDGGQRENRAAYWDNNVVYIGDSCKPSATVLKPYGASFHELLPVMSGRIRQLKL